MQETEWCSEEFSRSKRLKIKSVTGKSFVYHEFKRQNISLSLTNPHFPSKRTPTKRKKKWTKTKIEGNES